MVATIGKLIAVLLFLLTGTSVPAEVPVSYSGSGSYSSSNTGVSKQESSRPGMLWQIRPGEDILQIARLIFPDATQARKNLVHAIIQNNPEHFPGGVYRPIPAGTTLHIPDLRTISAYAKPATQSRQSGSKKNPTQRESQETTQESAQNQHKDHQLTLTLITQLERIADGEVNQLNLLTRHVESMETQIAAIQSLLLLKVASAQEKQIENVEFIAETEQEPQIIAIIQPEDNTSQINPVIVTAEDIVQPIENSVPSNDFNAVSLDVDLFSDTTFLFGVLLTLLIILMMLRSHKKIKERFMPPPDESLTSARHRYAEVLLQHTEKIIQSAENSPDARDQTASAAHAFTEQETPEVTIELLQKQLATNQHDIPTWLMLFEVLYKSNNKRDFKKNARRFKRMKIFPDIWRQIQTLGNRLEPNESLYFDEQKRREKFFSDTSEAS
ncbi:type IV pilus assembly protein FimV [Nitrosomonas ureae]|uniref:LysM domain-containing protein n=1 Tax=Nitrosomonas ureae TaxID=44577 RepID=A0A1H9FF84_9PROT|nr:hypothetical protein [Nitrosomonas ureae]SEQ36611.1 hypothetical protein SAMN05421510_104219 [Nitrosomonas ureae]